MYNNRLNSKSIEHNILNLIAVKSKYMNKFKKRYMHQEKNIYIVKRPGIKLESNIESQKSKAPRNKIIIMKWINNKSLL